MRKASTFTKQARAEAELRDKEADRKDALYRELIREEEVRPLIYGVVVCHIREAHRMLVLDDEGEDKDGLGSEFATVILVAPCKLTDLSTLDCCRYSTVEWHLL